MMAKYRILYSKLLSVCSVAVVLSSAFVSAGSSASRDGSHLRNVDLNITALPPNVAQIVEAISNVQKNVSKSASKSKVPNIKVAGLTNDDVGITRNLTVLKDAVPDLELQLFEPEESFVPEILDVNNDQTSEPESEISSSATSTEKNVIADVTVKSTSESTTLRPQTTRATTRRPRPTASNQGVGAVVVQTTTPTVLNPPETGLLSFEGVRQWINWVRSMRDPNINPEGPQSWPIIIGRGLSTIIRIYNPLRRIFGRRSLDDPLSIKTLSKDHPYRDEILKAIKNKEISGDVKSINAFVHKLQRVKIAEKISAMSKTDKIASAKQDEDVVEDTVEPIISLRPLAAPIADAIESIRNFTGEIESAIFAPFDFVPSQVDAAADLFDAPFDTVVRVPFYVKYVNIALKALYILIPLIYIPLFSGIENFFLAPIPPEIDTLPGMLRMFGLQAIMGPDYLYDYSDEAEAAEGEEATSAAEDEEDEYYYDDEYYDDEDVRRNRRKDEVSKNKKPKKRKKINKQQDQEKEDVNGKETRYTNLAPEMRPPPSRYSGQSSYSSILATQNIQPVYLYPLNDVKYAATPHPPTVQAPVQQIHYQRWRSPGHSASNVPTSSSPSVAHSSVAAPSSAAREPHSVTHGTRGQQATPVRLASGGPTFGTPVVSGEPIVPIPSVPSYQYKLAPDSRSRPSVVVRDGQIDISHYEPPVNFGTQLHKPVLHSVSNDALFSQVEEIRENFLVAPNYSSTTTTELVSQSITEVPQVSTSITTASETNSFEIRPIYIKAPTIIRTSTVLSRFPSTASATP